MTFRDLLAVLLIVATVAALAAPIVVLDLAYLPRHPAAHDLPWAATALHEDAASEPFNRTMTDKVHLLYPDLVHARREALAGRFPEWNPYILGGVPHVANPLTAVFYPPNWLLLLVEPLDALLLSAVLHVFLGGLFFLLFLRTAGVRPVAALLGALAFAWSGWIGAHLHNTALVAVVVWIPLGLCALEARFRGHGRWSLMVLALAVAMMWLAGFPQLAVYGSLALALYAAVGLLARTPGAGIRFALRQAGGLLVFAIIGLLLAGIQILPTLEGMPDAGHHGQSGPVLVSERFRPGAWIGLVLPGTLGSPMAPSDWRQHMGARIALGEGPEVLPPLAANWSERTIYPGLLVLVLAAAGLVLARSRVVLSLALIGATGALLATHPRVIEGLARVPGFNVGAPARAIVLLALVVPALAAFGLHHLVERAARATSPPLPWLRRALVVVAIVTAVIVAAGYLAEARTIEGVAGVLKSFGVEERFGTASRPASEYVETFRPAFADLRRDLVRVLLVTGGAALLLELACRRRRRPAVAVLGLVVLVLADLWSVFIPVNRPVKEEGLFVETPGLGFLRQHLGSSRFARVSATEAEALEDLHVLYPPNLGMLHELADAQGYREQVPGYALALWKDVAAAVAEVGISGVTAEKADSPVLDLARVRYLIAARPIAALAERQVHPPPGAATSDLWIYENPGTVPRAYIVHRARSLPAAEARELLRGGQIDLAEEVLLEAWPEGVERSQFPVGEGASRVEIVREVAGELVLRLDPRGPGFLVVTDTWHPGWKAEITDASGRVTEAPVVRAMTSYRAVPVAAGAQTVRLYYRSDWITAGGVLTGLGWIGLLLLPLFPRGRTKPSRPSNAGAAAAPPDAT